MAGYTPGPWVWEGSYSLGYTLRAKVGSHTIDIIDDGSASGEYGYVIDYDSPNAHLISAAPDMLEALKNIENDDGIIPAPIWEMVTKAIAKAEGR